MDKETKSEENKSDQGRAETLSKDEIVALVNSAITGHQKRFAESFKKDFGATLQDVVKQAIAAQQPPEPKPDTQSQGQAQRDPAMVKLQEQLDQIRQKWQEAETKSKQTEERARRESTHAQLKEMLAQKGIKGVKASALIAHFESTGALRFDDEGQAQLAVKRTRVKGAKPEEVAFDLSEGIDDWSKTDDAKDFLPAPTSTPVRAPNGRFAGGQQPTTRVYNQAANNPQEETRRLGEWMSSEGLTLGTPSNE